MIKNIRYAGSPKCVVNKAAPTPTTFNAKMQGLEKDPKFVIQTRLEIKLLNYFLGAKEKKIELFY